MDNKNLQITNHDFLIYRDSNNDIKVSVMLINNKEKIIIMTKMDLCDLEVTNKWIKHYENMGLTNWKNSPDGPIYKYDVDIAKNYLNEKKLKDLNRIVTMYLDYAELQAENHNAMTMKDWVEKLNAFLQFNGKEILRNAGKISTSVAQELAYKEYDKFKVKQDKLYKSDFDNFLNEAKIIENGSDK